MSSKSRQSTISLVAHKPVKEKKNIWGIFKEKNIQHLYLDYDLCENKLYEIEMAANAKNRKKFHGVNIIEVIIIFEIALFSALITFFLQFVVEHTFQLRYLILHKIVEEYSKTPIICYLLYVGSAIIPAFLASIIVTYIEPKVPGSGVPMLKRYLNGLLVEDYFSLRVLFYKIISLLLTMLGGFPGGQEGPLFHICSLVACQITKNKILTFNAYLTDNEKRDYVLLAISVAIVLAFSSVVGSALLIFEEISNFWYANLLLTILYTGYLASFVFTWLPGTNYNVYNMPSLEDFSYNIYEIPLIVILGLIIGMMGALWNNIFQSINIFRKRYYKKKIHKLIDVAVLCIIIQSCSFLHFYFAFNCIPKDENPLKHYAGKEITGFCPEGTYESTATIWILDPGLQNHEIFIKKDPQFIFTIGYFYVLYFFTSALVTGSATTIGTFAPSMNIGALGGILYCFLLIYIWPNNSDFYPPKYALFGVAANLAAIFRISISAIAICITLSGIDISNTFPLASCLLCSLYIANLFSDGFYEIPNRTFRMVTWEVAHCLKGKVATDIMSHPVISLNIRETAGYILVVLRKYSRYSCFAVVKDYLNDDRSTGFLLGTISRIQLLVIISEKYYLENFDNWEMNTNLRLFRKHAKKFFDEKKRTITIPPGEENKIIDLSWFINPYPCRINVRNSCPELLTLFRGLSFRHLMVIDNNGRVLGIITRSDFICNLLKSKRRRSTTRKMYKLWSQVDSVDLSLVKV